MRKFVIDWVDFDKQLPSSNDFNSKAKRRQLFDEFDPKGNGILFQATVVRGLFRLYPRVGGITETKPLLNLVFRVARDTAPPIVPIGIDHMDRNQFRVLIVCLRSYLQLWDVFWNMKNSVDALLTKEDLKDMLPLFSKWGIDNSDLLENSLCKDFHRIKYGNNPNTLPFDKFADCCLRRVLPEMTRDDDDAERHDAEQLLRRTHPHLFLKDNQPSQSMHAIGGVTRALGMRPRLGMQKGPGTFDGGVTKCIWSNNLKRPGSVYMNDYRLPNQSCEPSPTHQSVVGLSQTPTNMTKLHHSQSDPAIRRPSRLLHSNFPQKAGAHWSQNHVDMYNTKQLCALKAAGGIILSPKSVSFK